MNGFLNNNDNDNNTNNNQIELFFSEINVMLQGDTLNFGRYYAVFGYFEKSHTVLRARSKINVPILCFKTFILAI